MPYHTRGSIHVIHTHTLPTSRKSCTNTAAASARRAHERRPYRTASLSAGSSRATASGHADWTCSLLLAPPKTTGPALDGTASSAAGEKCRQRRRQARGRDAPSRPLVARRVHWKCSGSSSRSTGCGRRGRLTVRARARTDSAGAGTAGWPYAREGSTRRGRTCAARLKLRWLPSNDSRMGWPSGPKFFSRFGRKL